jgi:hypothetical protein
MNRRRVLKRTTYAVGFLAVLVVFIGGPLFLWRAAPQQVVSAPTPTPVEQPIEIQSVAVVAHADSVDVVARVYNPNARAGIAHYPVNFVLFDSANTEMLRVPVESHILPGSLHYILALSVAVPRPVAKVTLDTPKAPAYANLSPAIALPSLGTFLLDRTQVQRGGKTSEEQKGIVTNNSAFDWQEVEVTALAFDAANNVIGVGTTFVGRLTSGENREFTIQWPASTVPTARVVTLATTNIFKEDNIIRAVGDPNLLR